MRADVRTRDNGRCRYCGRTDGIHQHHIAYCSEGGSHDAQNLICLCTEHHDLIHSDKTRWQPVCRRYIQETNAGRSRYLIDIDRDLHQ